MIHKKYSQTLGAALIGLASMTANAGNLPYLGTLNKECKGKTQEKRITIPSDVTDLTYYTDASCDTIFVAPPKAQITINKDRVSINSSASAYCPDVNQEAKDISELLAESRRVRSEADADGVSNADRIAMLRTVRRIKSELVELREVNQELYGTMNMANIAGGIAIGPAWTDMIKKMERANPGYHVERLPVYGAMIDMLKVNELNSGVSYSSALEGVIYQKVHGQEVTDRGLEDLNVIGLDISFDNRPVSFGQSADFSMILNPLGGCSLDRNGDGKLDSLEALGGRTAMTMTYYHPLETSANIIVKPNTSAIIKLLESYVDQGGGWVDANRFLKNIKQMRAIDVLIEPDATGAPIQLSDQDRSAITDQIIAINIDNLLKQIGSLAEMAVATSNTTYQERHRRKSCRDRGWFRGRKCKTHTWYVTKHKVNWKKAINAMKVSLNSDDLSSRRTEKRVYLLQDSVGSTISYKE